MGIRVRLSDFRASRGPKAIGYCADSAEIPRIVTTAQSRLLNCKEAGDEGWFGSWAEMAFTVSRLAPYLTTGREVARLEAAAICRRPIEVHNQFYEYLRYGNGRMPRHWPCTGPFLTEAYTRNTVPTFHDIGPVPQFIQIFATDPTDIANAKRVLLQGTDQNGATVYSFDGNPPVQVLGEYDVLSSPFTISPTTWSSITGVQKDITNGQVQFFKVDPTTGASVQILSMEPSEQVAAYRRYYFHPLPINCCPSSPAVSSCLGSPAVTSVAVTALVALEALPLVADTDYFTLQGGDGVIEAIIEECQAVRYSTMDTATAKQMSRERHNMAVQILNGILSRYMGIDSPAVSFKPFGSADLERVKIGMI